jgi:hydrogenase maturation protein HypF
MRDHRKITVQGIVQGVGFRPVVYGMANRQGLTSGVRSEATDMVIDVDRDPTGIDTFSPVVGLEVSSPAGIERVSSEQQPIDYGSALAIEDPFLNCSNRDPCFTTVSVVPDERERTPMAGFPVPTACQAGNIEGWPVAWCPRRWRSSPATWARARNWFTTTRYIYFCWRGLTTLRGS